MCFGIYNFLVNYKIYTISDYYLRFIFKMMIEVDFSQNDWEFRILRCELYRRFFCEIFIFQEGSEIRFVLINKSFI